MKRKIFLLLFLMVLAAALYSCLSDGYVYSSATVEFIPPGDAVLSVRDIRVKGFTLDWTIVPGAGYEYAVAASYNGNIDDYATAFENGKIALDFTPSEMLNGTYKVTQLIPGKEYEIKIFVRAKNIRATEYLKTKASIPYVDDAEIYNVWINGEETVFDKTRDSFSYYYLHGTEKDADGNEENYTFTYSLMNGCKLYIDGKKVEDAEIAFVPNEPLEVTIVNERTQAARDYTIYAGSMSNGLPIVVIDTERRIRDTTTNVAAHMRIIGGGYNSSVPDLFNGEIEIRGRGNSSFGMPKRSYNIEIAAKTQILDMAASKDWMLIANYADKSLMRNYTAYEFARDLGAEYAPKLRFVDLILNGEYVGTYCIGERIKIEDGRLNFPKINADTTDEYELTGTYVLEINNRTRLKPGEIVFTSTKINRKQSTVWGIAEGEVVVVKQPGEHNLPQAAFEYIRDYFNAAEDALFGENFKDPETGYRAYLDVDSFVDWYLINEFYKQVDGDFRLSTFLYKPRGDKLYMGPIWDFDLGAGNADYRSGEDPEGWYIRTSIWFERLFEDEAFEQAFKDRWNYLRDNGYFERFFQRIDDTAEMIEKSAQMNFKKWPILGTYVWPNANDFWARKTYQSEIDYLKEWLTSRMEWIDNQVNK